MTKRRGVQKCQKSGPGVQSLGENKDNRRTRSGDRLAAVAKLRARRKTRKGQQEDNGRTQHFPALAETVASFFVIRETPNSKPVWGTQGWQARPGDNSRTTASTRRTRGEQDPAAQRSGVQPATVFTSSLSPARENLKGVKRVEETSPDPPETASASHSAGRCPPHYAIWPHLPPAAGHREKSATQSKPGSVGSK